MSQHRQVAEIVTTFVGVHVRVRLPCNPWLTRLSDYIHQYLPDDECTAKFSIDGPTLLINVTIDEERLLYLRKLMGSLPDRRLYAPHPGQFYRSAELDGGRLFELIQDAEDPSVVGRVVVKRVNHSVDLVLSPQVHDVERKVFRLIRELAIRFAENRGAIVLHAAGVVLNDRAVMLPGISGSGKTTLLSCLLTIPGVKFLSNDRVLLVPTNGGDDVATCLAVPMAVRLGRGTLEANERLLHHIMMCPELRREQSAPVGLLDSSFGARQKLELTPREMTTAFKARLSAGAHLGFIVYPMLLPDEHSVTTSVISPPVANELIAQSRFTPTDEAWAPWVLERDALDEELRAAADAALERVVGHVQNLRVQFGTNSDPSDVADAVLALLGRG